MNNIRKDLTAAADPKTSPKMLDELSAYKGYLIRYYVADNPSTPVETLDKLSNSTEVGIRFNVATNHNTSQKTLEKLSGDGNWHIRCGVATNPMTHPDTLDKLSLRPHGGKRCDFEICNAIANNPAAYMKTRERLKNEEIIMGVI